MVVQYVRDTLHVNWRLFPINIFSNEKSFGEKFVEILRWKNEIIDRLRE
jgi:hypothetical protein